MMRMIARFAVVLAVIVVGMVGCAQQKSIRVVVWDEQQPKQQPTYANFLGNHIADHLRQQKRFTIRSVGMDDPQQGLPDELLDNCDVLIWWGHRRQGEISVETARGIVERIKAGKLSLIVLHSAHWSTPFVLAMQERTLQDALAGLTPAQRAKMEVGFHGDADRNAPAPDAELTPSISYEKREDGTTVVHIIRPNCCFPYYKAHGKPSRIKTLLPSHPIANGIPEEFTLAQTEMYGEPFHVPAPDAVIFEERWQAGQWFRSGALWSLGKGKVFYFRPGHENFNVFHQPEPLKIITNAARWLADEISKQKGRQ